jgi:hypothetical protein
MAPSLATDRLKISIWCTSFSIFPFLESEIRLESYDDVWKAALFELKTLKERGTWVAVPMTEAQGRVIPLVIGLSNESARRAEPRYCPPASSWVSPQCDGKIQCLLSVVVQ